MYREKLIYIYDKEGMNSRFHTSLVTSLGDFIDWNLDRNKRYLSPFQFANKAGITTDLALAFFMFFSKKDGIFDIVYFFECSTHNCGERIFLEKENYDDADTLLFCEECLRSYKLENVKRYIKVYFQLIQESSTFNVDRYDPNCAFDVLKRMPDTLKAESPSSLNEQIENEGDNLNHSINLEKMIEINSSYEKPIIDDDVFLQVFLDYIHD